MSRGAVVVHDASSGLRLDCRKGKAASGSPADGLSRTSATRP